MAIDIIVVVTALLGGKRRYSFLLVVIIYIFTMNMYPSIKLSTIKKSVVLFTIKLTAASKKTVNICLDLIRFGMSSTLISFYSKYYEYHGSKKEGQGLAIGGYESAFLAELVASYLFDKSKALLNTTT